MSQILLAGYPPWWSEGDKFVGKINYDPSVWNQYRGNSLSSINLKIQKKNHPAFIPLFYEDSAQSLVDQLAHRNREERWDANQALNSEWYASKLGSDHLTRTHENLKAFNARRKFKAGVNMIRVLLEIKKNHEKLKL